MNYKYSLVLLGLMLFALGLVVRGWVQLLIWVGGNFLALGFAHWKGSHNIFGKQANGTLCIWRQYMLFPLLAYTTVVWYLMRFFSRELASQHITEHLAGGRRLLPSETEQQFENYIDLTAEFSEPKAIRVSSSYHSFLILDEATPTPRTMKEAIDRLRPARTFVDCAQGLGRTGFFALAMLLETGAAKNIEDGLRTFAKVHPTVRLNKTQCKCIQDYEKNFLKTS